MAAPAPKIVPSRADNKEIVLSHWMGGMNSGVHPADLRQGQYYYGENIINRGGILQTRPGHRYLGAIAGTLLQGMITYRPKGGTPTMLVAVDGRIWMAKAPFSNFARIPEIHLSANAPIVTFTVCVRASKRNADETISLIEPITTVIIQDGVSQAACYDGVTARHLNPEPPFSETPTGLWGAWSGSRYWVIRGTRLYASDLADPLTFKETTYLAQRSAFELPDEGTGAIETSTGGGLLVFTEDTATLFKSYIVDREEWRTTGEFQKIVLPSIGCVSGRSVVNQHGTTHWFSRIGLVNLDVALNANRTSEVVPIDGQLNRSKTRLSPDLSQVATVAAGNLLLCSVPAGSKYNTHTWVLDQSPVELVEEGNQKIAPRAWAGIWTGVRPVAWSSVTVGGRKRIYFASRDETSKDGSQIHLWEAFDLRKRDNGNRILCVAETAMVNLPEKHKFRYAEFDLCELSGLVEFRVWAGTEAGEWHPVLDTELRADSGPWGSAAMPTITEDTIIRSFKPQTRTVRTEELSAGNSECPAETKNPPGEGRYIQLLIEWKGRCGVKAIRMICAPKADGKVGECRPTERDNTGIVDEQGRNVEIPA